MSDETKTDERAIKEVVDLLNPDRKLFFITGAGVSADSGLPTYRGTGGIYEVQNTEDDMPIERALSGPVFRSRPEITWKYLAQIGHAARGARYNRAHQVIAEMQDHFSDVRVLTQNVDAFHTDAGSKQVIEIHGNLRRIQCLSCEYQATISPAEELDIPPLCPECTAVLRPQVVLFEEMLPLDAQSQLQDAWNSGFDMVFSVGTTSVFPYIAEPFVWASRSGLPAIEINPDRTVVSDNATHRIGMPAARALDRIWNEYQKKC